MESPNLLDRGDKSRIVHVLANCLCEVLELVDPDDVDDVSSLKISKAKGCLKTYRTAFNKPIKT